MVIPFITKYINQKAAEQATATLKSFFPNFMNQLSWGMNRQDMKNVEIFANWSGICIDILAKATAKIDNQIFQGEKEIADKSFWLKSFFNDPTHKDFNLTWIEIKELLLKWLFGYGNAYLYIPNIYKYPLQCWVLPSRSVSVVPSKFNGRMIDHYNFYSVNGLVPINPDEIIHFKTMNPSEDYISNFLMGSPYQLNSAKQAILNEQEKKIFEQKFYEREGVRPIFIKTDKFLSQDQWKAYKALINETMPKNFQVAGLLADGLDFKALDIGMSGTASSTSMNTDNKENQKIIARSFGIPFGILDTESQQNRATAETNEANFRTGTVEYWVKWFETALTKYFQRYDSSISIGHETFIWDNPEDIIKRQTFELSYGIKSINDIRIQNGYEPVKDGDMPLIPTNLRPLTMDNVGLPPLNETPAKQFKEETNIQPDELTKVLIWKSLDKLRSQAEKKIQDKSEKFLTQLRDEYLKSYKKSFTKVSESQKIDIQKWSDKLSNDLSPEMSDHLKNVINQSINDYDPTAKLTDFEREFEQTIKTATEDPQTSLNTIFDEMEERLKKIKLENPNATDDELNKMWNESINTAFDGSAKTIGYIKAKAKTIAVMTSGIISNAGMDVVIKKVGLQKTWLSRRDGIVRSDHRQMDSQLAVKGVFTAPDGTKGQFPCCSTFSKKERVHCRCYMFATK